MSLGQKPKYKVFFFKPPLKRGREREEMAEGKREWRIFIWNYMSLENIDWWWIFQYQSWRTDKTQKLGKHEEFPINLQPIIYFLITWLGVATYWQMIDGLDVEQIISTWVTCALAVTIGKQKGNKKKHIIMNYKSI